MARPGRRWRSWRRRRRYKAEASTPASRADPPAVIATTSTASSEPAPPTAGEACKARGVGGAVEFGGALLWVGDGVEGVDRSGGLGMLGDGGRSGGVRV